MHPAGPCNHCGTVSTPCWRSGPAEKPHLCNACGSRWSAKRDLTGYFPGRRASATGQKEERDSERYCYSHDDDLPDVRAMFIPTKKRKRTRSLPCKPDHPNKAVVGPYSRSPPRSIRTQVFVPIPERKEASTQTDPIKTQVVLVRAGPSNVSSMTQQLPSILERLPSGMGVMETLSRTSSSNRDFNGQLPPYLLRTSMDGSLMSGNHCGRPCPALFKSSGVSRYSAEICSSDTAYRYE